MRWNGLASVACGSVLLACTQPEQSADEKALTTGQRVSPVEVSSLSSLSSPSAGAGHRFGAAVDLDEAAAVIGEPGNNVAYRFRPNAAGSVWSLAGSLVPPEAHEVQGFGSCVAIDGSTIVVGAPEHENQLGRAYVFRCGDEPFCTLQAELQAPDNQVGLHFGTGVSVHGTTVFVAGVGASQQGGRVYRFSFDDVLQSWRFADAVVPSQSSAGDEFGQSMALFGDLLMIGAPGAASQAGAVYVFERDGVAGTWKQRATLAEPAPIPGNRFGHAVSLWERSAVVTSLRDPEHSAVYVLRSNGSLTPWTVEATLVPGEESMVDFGIGASLWRNVAIVSAHSASSTSVLPVFSRDLASGAWTLGNWIGFGKGAYDCPQALHRSFFVVGEPDRDNGAGIVHFFRVGEATGGICQNSDECLTGFCADGRCCNAACDGPCDRCDAADEPGKCRPAPSGSVPSPPCDGYTCNGVTSSCSQECSDAKGCVASHWCDGSTCVSRGDLGSSCSAGEQCSSGSCSQGVCCNQPCAGCGTCNLEGAKGECRPVKGASPDCIPYMCDGLELTCPKDCRDKLDCAVGNACQQGACVPLQAPGTACESSSLCQSGKCTDGVCCLDDHCGAYRCRNNGSCGQECQSAAECATNHECTSDKRCLPIQPGAASGSEGGCAVGANRERLDRGWFAALSIAALLWLSRRRLDLESAVA